MGGKNHQPCNRPKGNVYLRLSTQLSRALSQAHGRLELANVALEDVILTELEGTCTTLDAVRTRLAACRSELKTAQDTCRQLAAALEEHGFEDLPTLRSVNLETVGGRLALRRAVDRDAWLRISETYREHGFSEVISLFDTRIGDLDSLTEQLMDEVNRLDDWAELGQVYVALDENKQGNLKLVFAALYTSWASFNQDFLASALISTELWYNFIGAGSLVDGEVHRKIA